MNDKVTLKKSKVMVALRDETDGGEFSMHEIDGYKLLVNGKETGLSVHREIVWEDGVLLFPSYKGWAVSAANGFYIFTPTSARTKKDSAKRWAWALVQELRLIGAPEPATGEWFNYYMNVILDGPDMDKKMSFGRVIDRYEGREPYASKGEAQ